METRKRRSRMRRVSSGKRIELTQRDLELFKLLDRYRYLRSDYLYAFLGGQSETRFKERLGALYHDGRYINRPEQQWEYANSRYMPAVYELDEKGEQVLRDQELVHNDSPLLASGRTGAYRQFAHQLMICECLASIELGVRRSQGLRFVSWQDILTKAPEQTRQRANPFELPVSISHLCPRTGNTRHASFRLVPDGLFGLEYGRNGQRTYRFFALEVDRATMPVKRSDLSQSSFLRKILAYRQLVMQGAHRMHLGIPNLFVLTVTTNASHMASIMKLVEELAPEQRSKLFLFKSIAGKATPDTADHMLSEPWQRVGCDAFRIDDQ